MAQRSDKTAQRRSGVIVGIAAAAALAVGLAGCSAPSASGDNSSASSALQPKKPAKPITLTVLDGGGDLTGGGQAAIDAFVKANPALISNVTYQTAAAPDVAGKLLAQAQGGSVSVSLVLGGSDVLGSAEAQSLVIKQIPTYSSNLPKLSEIQDEGRANFQALADGNGLLIGFDQNGPLISNSPKVSATDIPKTPEAILAWAKAHRGKFAYAQPANSGSGRTFMESLPYMLGEKDPSDPKNGWTKTWAYLKELGKYISSYPASSTLLNQQFGAGQLEIIPTVLSHDISFRSNGTLPAGTSVNLFTDQNWVSDGHFAMIPKGIDAQTLYVDLKLESYMVSAQGQEPRLKNNVLTTANKNMTVEAAGGDVQAYVQKWGRPDFYPAALKTGTVRVPLTPSHLQEAFTIWQEQIGSSVGQ